MSGRLKKLLPTSLAAVLKRARYSVRRILGSRRLQQRIRAARELRLVVGSAGVYESGWIPTDLEYLNLLREADWERHFRDSSVAAILAEHVWEHLTPEEGARAARCCHRFLRPGGYLRLAVPDGHHPDPEYREWVRVGGSGPGADDHKVLYTRETLQALLEAAGFTTTWLEYFDAQGEFHFANWNPTGGMVHRSKRFDPRNHDGTLRYTSLIVDAVKPRANGNSSS